MKTLKKVSILIPILLIGLFNYAQAANAVLKGKVVDKVSKSALPLVNVYLKNTSGKLVKSTSTDLNGKFEIKDITPDKYNITVDIIGYKKLEKYNVVFASGETKNIVFELQSNGVLAEIISVADEKIESKKRCCLRI